MVKTEYNLQEVILKYCLYLVFEDITLHEVIMVSGIMETSTKTSVSGYLNSKWGV